MPLEHDIEKCFRYIYPANTKPVVTKKDLTTVLRNNCSDQNYIHKYPYTVLWKVTTACNLRCEHCLYLHDADAYESKADFSFNEMMETAKFFVEELNLIGFSLSGGEPFLRKDIFELLKYLSEKNISVDIKTNATLITKEVARRLAEILNLKTTVIQVSLEGATKEIHDKIRGVGSFEKTINGINNLTELGFKVPVSCTVTSENLERLQELYSLCKDLKVCEILFGKLRIYNHEQEYLKPNLEDLFHNIAAIIDISVHDKSVKINPSVLQICDFLNYEIGIKLADEYVESMSLKTVTNPVCHNHNRFVLNADGRIYFCTGTEVDELCLGNLKEDSFYNIWDSRFNNIFFQSREKCVCTKCKYVTICNAGCPSRSYRTYGDINAPDGECEYGKRFYKVQNA